MSMRSSVMSVAFEESHRYRIKMKPAAGALVLFGLVEAGCGTARSVGHVVTAPARLVHEEVAGKPSQATTTSDVEVPGRPVPATPTPSPRQAQNKPKPKPSPEAPRREVLNEPQFPVAKAVPGKPGLVYNPFDPNGGLIDVSGYAPGSKVKDPDSQKIFVVP
jgi:hypothetical protein